LTQVIAESSIFAVETVEKYFGVTADHLIEIGCE
jgi:hypothetical protein